MWEILWKVVWYKKNFLFNLKGKIYEALLQSRGIYVKMLNYTKYVKCWKNDQAGMQS